MEVKLHRPLIGKVKTVTIQWLIGLPQRITS
jgi:hypothetical protein